MAELVLLLLLSIAVASTSTASTSGVVLVTNLATVTNSPKGLWSSTAIKVEQGIVLERKLQMNLRPS